MNPPSPTLAFSQAKIPTAPKSVVTQPPAQAAQAKTLASGAIPPVSSPPLPQQAMQFLTFVIAAGGSQHVGISGNYFYIDDVTFTGTNQPLSLFPISFKTSASPVLVPVGATRIGYNYPSDFDWVEIQNPVLGVAVTVTIWIGHGYVEDNRVGYTTTGEQAVQCTSQWTRPNNVVAYAADQVVGENPATIRTFTGLVRGAVRTSNGMGRITRARMYTNSPTIANASFRLWLQSDSIASPAPLADQAVYPLLAANLFALLRPPIAFIDFPLFVTGGAGSDAAVCEIDGISVDFMAGVGTTSIFGQVVAKAAYVPLALQVFGIDLDVVWYS